MAYIAAIGESVDDTTTGTHTGSVPLHQEDDLLLWIVAKRGNAGGDLTTPAGWTLLAHEGSQTLVRGAVFYKIAANSSEANPSTTTESNQRFVSHLLTIRDADTSDPFNQHVFSGHGNATSFTHPTVTTDEDDCLLVYTTAHGGATRLGYPQPGLIWHGMLLGGGQVTQTLQYSHQEAQGVTPAVDWIVNVNTASVRGLIAINNKTGGSRETYIGNPSTLGTLITPLFTNVANSGVSPTDTFTISAVGTKTTLIGLSTTTDSDRALMLGARSMRLQFHEALDPVTTARGIQFNLNPTLDLSVGTFMLNVDLSYPTAFTRTAEIPEGSFLVVFVDSNDSYAAYQCFAFDSSPRLDFNRTLYIDTSQTTTAWATSGTVDVTDIDRILVLLSTPKSGGALQSFYSEMNLSNTMAIVGGDENRPINNASLFRLGRPYRHIVIDRLGSSSFLSYIPLQIGDGDKTTYCDIRNSNLQFPLIYSEAEKQLNYHSSPGNIGIEYHGVSGDFIHHTDSTITSDSPYYWRIHTSATSAADWDFSGLGVVGAIVTLRNIATFEGMAFTNCVSIDASSCTLLNCSIRGLTTHNSLTLNSSSEVNDCTLSARSLDAGDSITSVADPSIFNGCIFQGATTGGHAIRITTPGAYSFVGNSFSDFGANDSNSAAIFNDSGGEVIINISGGGDTPTVRNGASATTTINNTVQITLTGLQENTEVRVYEDDDGVNGDEIDGVENSGTSFAFSAEASQVVNIIINHLNFLPADIWGFTMPAGDATIPINQFVDRQYENPD